jgi:hypothetical protein
MQNCGARHACVVIVIGVAAARTDGESVRAAVGLRGPAVESVDPVAWGVVDAVTVPSTADRVW